MLKKFACLALAVAGLGTAVPTVALADECGYWAFAGAYSSRSTARREANRLGVSFYDLDESDSPNAGRGLWVVASGPYEWERDAQKEARWLNRQPRVKGAYVNYVCFYD